MSFWKNKPLFVSNNKDLIKQESLNSKDSIYILENKVLNDKINLEIENAKFKLDYKIINVDSINYNNELNEILNFINKYYVRSDKYSLEYSLELLKFWINDIKDCLIIKFYPKDYDDMIGIIIGKKIELYNKIYNKNYCTLEVNFLCIKPNLRNMGLSSLMINILTNECLKYYNDIKTALYSISKKINAPNFCKTSYSYILTTQNLDKHNKIKNNFNDIEIEYFNNDKSDFENFEKNIKILYLKSQEYYNKHYDIYKVQSYVEFYNLFTNCNFHHFIIRDKVTKEIIDYICLFSIKSNNLTNNQSIKNGYYYCGFHRKNNLQYLEKIYINILNKIKELKNIDILIVPDSQKICKSNNLNIFKNGGDLYFYMYNMKCIEISAEKFGFITI